MFDSDEDIIVSFITTQLKWQERFAVRVEPSNNNGLKKDSLIRLNKITTIDKKLVIGKLGQLSDSELEEVNYGLIALLGLK